MLAGSNETVVSTGTRGPKKKPAAASVASAASTIRARPSTPAPSPAAGRAPGPASAAHAPPAPAQTPVEDGKIERAGQQPKQFQLQGEAAGKGDLEAAAGQARDDPGSRSVDRHQRRHDEI